MPKKTIIANITLHVPSGHYSADEAPIAQAVPPGTEVTLDAEEADRIVKRWGGEILAVIPDEASAP